MFKLKKYVKRSVYLVLYFTGIVHLSMLINKKFKNELPSVILFYHRFTEAHTEKLPPKLNAKIFEKQLRHLKKLFHIISLDELVDNLKTGKKFSYPCVVITIDDGFKDNYDSAFPLLKRYDIFATIYLTTGFIGTDSAPWIEEIAYALNTTPRKNLKFEKLFHNKTFNISNHMKKFDLWTEIYEKMLYLQHDTKNDLVTEILQKLNGGKERKTRVMLDWDEVGEMSRNQISFGAHSVSHPTLSRMHPDEAMFEIRESRQVIEEKLGVSVRHFAVPNGKDEDFTEQLREFCKSEGFDSVVTTNYGVVTKESDPYALPRVSPSEPIYVFAAELARLFIFGR